MSSAAGGSASGSVISQQQSTQAYLQQHQIPRVLEDVVAKMARERPADPFTFLVSHTRLPTPVTPATVDSIDTSLLINDPLALSR